MSLQNLLARCLMLRCPACGKGKLAKDWRETNLHCQQCGHDFRVETGFYLGSIYFNYGVTAVLGIAIGLPLYLSGWMSPLVLAGATVVFCVLFSLWFFCYARSLWLAFDYYYCHESRGLGHDVQEVVAMASLPKPSFSRRPWIPTNPGDNECPSVRSVRSDRSDRSINKAAHYSMSPRIRWDLSAQLGFIPHLGDKIGRNVAKHQG